MRNITKHSSTWAWDQDVKAARNLLHRGLVPVDAEVEAARDEEVRAWNEVWGVEPKASMSLPIPDNERGDQ